MHPRLIDLLIPYNSISIIGMSKNAGKTTVLNKILAECHARGIRVGITSIGRDGEDVDIVTGTDKPKIFVSKGTFIATAAQLLAKSDITKEIMRTTQINTPMGEVVVVRARSDGYVQIGGPSIGSQIVSLIEKFRELGADKVFVDGAISRKTLGGPATCEAAILSTGASFSSDMNKVVNETAFVAKLLTCEPLKDERTREVITTLAESTEKFVAIMPDCSVREMNLDGLADAAEGASHIYVSGALSDGLANKLIMSNTNLRGVKIVVEDGSKLFVTESTFEKFGIKGAKIAVMRPTNLLAITMNPVSAGGYVFDKNAFREALSAKVAVPVYDVVAETELDRFARRTTMEGAHNGIE